MNKTQRNLYFGQEDEHYVKDQLDKMPFSNIDTLDKQIREDQKRTFRFDLLEADDPDKIAYREHFVIDSLTSLFVMFQQFLQVFDISL